MSTEEQIQSLLKLNFRGVDGPFPHGSGALSFRVWADGSSGRVTAWVVIHLEMESPEAKKIPYAQHILKAVRMAKRVLSRAGGSLGRRGLIVVSAAGTTEVTRPAGDASTEEA